MDAFVNKKVKAMKYHYNIVYEKRYLLSKRDGYTYISNSSVVKDT